MRNWLVEGLKRSSYGDILTPHPPGGRAKCSIVLAGVVGKDLLNYGVPPERMADVWGATEDTILQIASRLPEEACESVLCLAIGAKPPIVPRNILRLLVAVEESFWTNWLDGESSERCDCF